MAWLGEENFDWTNVSHRQLSVVEIESAASFRRTRWKSGVGMRGDAHRAEVECRLACRQRALNGVILNLGAAESNKLSMHCPYMLRQFPRALLLTRDVSQHDRSGALIKP